MIRSNFSIIFFEADGPMMKKGLPNLTERSWRAYLYSVKPADEDPVRCAEIFAPLIHTGRAPRANRVEHASTGTARGK